MLHSSKTDFVQNYSFVLTLKNIPWNHTFIYCIAKNELWIDGWRTMSYDVLEASSEREEDLIYGSDEQLSSILLPAILSRDYTNSSPEERHLFWYLCSEKSLMMKCCMFGYSWGRVKNSSNSHLGKLLIFSFTSTLFKRWIFWIRFVQWIEIQIICRLFQLMYIVRIALTG